MWPKEAIDALGKAHAEIERLKAREDYCHRNFIALDFDYGEDHECVMVIKLPSKGRYNRGFANSIDAALGASPSPPTALWDRECVRCGHKWKDPVHMALPCPACEPQPVTKSGPAPDA